MYFNIIIDSIILEKYKLIYYICEKIKLNKLSLEYSKALLAAKEASELIVQFYEHGFSSDLKADGSPVTEADLASSLKIHEHLKETNIPILGEESLHPSFEVRSTWKKNWCVDPLDGTKEYISRNGEFAVCIAMIENHSSIFGVIAWPLNQKILFGGKGIGVFIADFNDIDNSNNWIELYPKKSCNNPLIVLASRSFHLVSEDFNAELKSKHSDVELKKKGSALKFFDLAQGKADIYPRFTPSMEWDIAAGHAILKELGGEIFNIENGLPLVYNKEDLRNPSFIAKTKPMI